MVSKLAFLKLCKNKLSGYMNVKVVEDTINELNKYKLSQLRTNQDVPQKILTDSVSILFARLSLLKGDEQAEEFLHQIDKVIDI